MEESTKYLLVGGGMASVWAAQNIRERDKEGRVLIVTNEHHPPYDKPPLSKSYIAKEEVAIDDAYSKFDNFYPDNNIDLKKETEVKRLDRSNRTAHLENGDTIRYEKLLLATGADPRELDVPGSDLNGVFYLRTIDEALGISNAAKTAKRAVLIGAGYLNMEVASGLAQRGVDVTVIEREDRPWSRLASRKLGDFLRRTYEGAGIKFVFGEEVTAFMGGGAVAAVSTKSGARYEAEFVVVAVGASLRTQLAKDAGLELGDRGGVVVDEYLQTADPNVWAAGDIAYFNDLALGRRWHAEHHLNAKWQGQVAGANMAGERKAYDRVPYFFSDFLDLHMILRGDPSGSTQRKTVVFGSLEGGEFVELYPDESERLLMGVAISHEEPKLDPISDKLDELFRARADVRDLDAAAFGL